MLLKHTARYSRLVPVYGPEGPALFVCSIHYWTQN